MLASPTATLQPEEVLTVAHIHGMRHPDRTAYVKLALLGQWRIVLCERPRGPAGDGFEEWQGHGSIVRQCCTYDVVTAVLTLAAIVAAEDPDAYLESLARPWNCDYPGGRIRLDNLPPWRVAAG